MKRVDILAAKERSIERRRWLERLFLTMTVLDPERDTMENFQFYKDITENIEACNRGIALFDLLLGGHRPGDFIIT